MVVQLSNDGLNRAFRALADPTRRDILRRTMLAQATVSELAADYEMSFAAVQKHVSVLEKAGLVEKTAVGRERHVNASPDQIRRVRACLLQLEELWRHRLTGLDAVLSEPKE